MAHTLYDNFVLANKVEDFLITNVDLMNYATPDYSLSETAGMKKVINKYTATGNVQDLAMGVGNSEEIQVAFTPVEYTVGTTQGKLPYYDEEEMKDPMVVEVGLKKLTEQMANDLTTKIINALGTGSQTFQMTSWSFENFADAIAEYPYESEEGLFLLINPDDKAAIRKALKDDLKYVEDFSRTGYIGHVCGVPVIVSKAVNKGEVYLATKEAVTVFIKKGTEIEQSRDANTRKNEIFARKYMVVALTDDTRVIRLVRP